MASRGSQGLWRVTSNEGCRKARHSRKVVGVKRPKQRRRSRRTQRPHLILQRHRTSSPPPQVTQMGGEGGGDIKGSKIVVRQFRTHKKRREGEIRGGEKGDSGGRIYRTHFPVRGEQPQQSCGVDQHPHIHTQGWVWGVRGKPGNPHPEPRECPHQGG